MGLGPCPVFGWARTCWRLPLGERRRLGLPGGARTRLGSSGGGAAGAGCANTLGIVEGVREHAWGVPGVARPAPHPAARFWMASGCVRGVRSCCSIAASLRLDACCSGALRTRPLRAGSPVNVPAWVWLVDSGPPARGIVLFRLHPAGSRLARTRTLRRHPCRRSVICRRLRGRRPAHGARTPVVITRPEPKQAVPTRR